MTAIDDLDRELSLIALMAALGAQLAATCEHIDVRDAAANFKEAAVLLEMAFETRAMAARS